MDLNAAILNLDVVTFTSRGMSFLASSEGVECRKLVAFGLILSTVMTKRTLPELELSLQSAMPDCTSVLASCIVHSWMSLESRDREQRSGSLYDVALHSGIENDILVTNLAGNCGPVSYSLWLQCIHWLYLLDVAEV